MRFRNLRDKDLVFNEEEHIYTYKGIKLVSVTEFLSKFYPVFDKDKASEAKSKKTGISKEIILKEWEDNKDFALDFGTKIHKYAEQRFKGYDVPFSDDERERSYQLAVEKFIEDHPKLVYIESELGLVSPVHGLAGTADLLLSDGAGQYFLYDWKTSKEIKEANYFGDKLLAPLEYIDDCNFMRYSLQLNVYSKMLNRKGIYPKGMYIIHLFPEGYKEYKCPVLEEEVDNLMLINLLNRVGL